MNWNLFKNNLWGVKHIPSIPFDKWAATTICPKDYGYLPNWVEIHEGFVATAWRLDGVHNTSAVANIVTYNPKPTSDEFPFAKVVLTKDNVPFKQMDNLCKELSILNAKRDKNPSYDSTLRIYIMDLNGKVRDKTGQFLPDGFAVRQVVNDLSYMYMTWMDFPEIDDWAVVTQMSLAKDKFRCMMYEEKHKEIHNRIVELRKQIEENRREIERLEAKSRQLYEDAADGLNILEQHGVNVKRLMDEVS